MTTRADKPLVLVTGSSGLIGSKLVSDLTPAYRVVALDVEEPASVPAGAAFIECDLTDEASVKQAITRVANEHGRRVASVVHLAAYYDFSGAPSPMYERLTVEGTRRLLRSLAPLDVEQLVFSSTMLVMKPSEDETISEGSPLQGEWDYPKSKIATERLLREEHGDIPVVILRLAGAYDEAGHSPPLTQQIKRIRERRLESFLFPGDKQHGQPFVHVDDVASAFIRAIERRRQLGPFEVFLIAEPEALSYEELQDRLGELIHGHEWTTLRIPAPIAKVGAWIEDKLSDDAFIKPWMVDLADANYPLSIERAQQKLGWTPKHDLRSTLPAMVARLERDPSAFYAENELGEAP